MSAYRWVQANHGRAMAFAKAGKKSTGRHIDGRAREETP